MTNEFKTDLMNTNKISEFDALYLKATQNKLSLDYINEINSLRKKYEGTEEFKVLDFRSKHLLSFIYSYNKLFEKSLEIDLDLLSGPDINHPGYFGLVNNAALTSVKLNRTNEVVPFAVSYLKNSNDSFGGKLHALKWYVDHFPQGEDGSFDAFEPVLSTMVSDMQAIIDTSLPFTDRVNILYKDHERAHKKLKLFQLHIKGVSGEDRTRLINNYQKREHLGWFRNYVSEHYQSKI